MNAFVFCLVVLFIQTATVPAQDVPDPHTLAGRGSTADGANKGTPEEGKGGRFPRFATFRTDTNVSTFLERAEELARAGRYDTAVRSLQKVFDATEQVLIERGPRVLRLAHRVAEDLLLQWGEEALDDYRIVADQPAGALFRQVRGRFDEQLLTRVVRRYFLSSYGDEAAYRLACYRLDQGDFASAYRLLTRIHERYPNPTVSRTDVLLRLAVAAARIGDREKARQLWAQYRTETSGPAPSWMRDIEKLVRGEARGGRIPEYDDSPVEVVSLPDKNREPRVPMVSRWEVSGLPAKDITPRFRVFRDLLEFAWRHDSRRSADKFIADGKRVWVSSAFGVGCFTVGGRKLWSTSGAKPLRHLSRDEARRLGLPVRGLDSEHLGIWSGFSDHMEGRISVSDGTLYRIEGSWFTYPRRVSPEIS